MLQNFIDKLTYAFHHMDGLEKAAFSFWALGTCFFYGSLVYILFLLAKEGLQKIFKKAI
jgi:hypothetical protein